MNGVRGYLARVGFMVLGATVIAAALGLAASALEHISPTTSGFGPWHPLELIPGFFLIACCSLLCIEVLATHVCVSTNPSKLRLLATGATCAAVAAYPIAHRLLYQLPNSDVLFIGVFVLSSAAVRLRRCGAGT